MPMIGRFAVLLLLALLATGALGQGAGARFDHVTTGYELTGAHRLQACESCHADAVFQGTPRECAACHSPGSRIGATPKSSDHVRTSEKCIACHTTSAWSPATIFDHDETMGGCASCHDNSQVPGKPAGHIATNMDCNACHGSVAWVPSKFDHGAITGNCASCHAAGGTATSKGPTHPATSSACETCHSSAAWSPVAHVDHAQVVGTCASCHDGTHATGRSATHIPSPDNCGTCHATSAWRPVRFDHAGVTERCATCHDGTRATGVGDAAHQGLDVLRRLSFDHDLEAGDPCRPRQRAGQLLVVPRRRHRQGQARQPHRDPGRVRQLPHRHRLEAGEIRPLPVREQLRELPRWHPRQGARPDPSADHGGVRVMPRHHRVEAGFDRRPHPGDRHLRLLPRRLHGHRQARQSHPDDGACDTCHTTWPGSQRDSATTASLPPASAATTESARPARAARTSARATAARPATPPSAGGRSLASITRW